MGIAEEIREYGEFNFPLTDGDRLYAYTNMPGKLHYLIRHPPHQGPARLLDEDYEVRLEGNQNTRRKSNNNSSTTTNRRRMDTNNTRRTLCFHKRRPPTHSKGGRTETHSNKARTNCAQINKDSPT